MKPTLQRSTPAILAILLASALSAQAALTLQIDPNTKTFALVGTDTGTPAVAAGGALVGWTISTGTSTDPENLLFNNDVAYSTTVGSPGHPVLGYDLQMNMGTVPIGELHFNLGLSDSGLQTLTGSGVFQSYAGFTATNQAAFESLAGQTMPIDGTYSVSGFSAITIVAVPEPSGALLAGFGVFCFAIRRRRAC